MSRSTWLATAGLLALLAGCADRTPLTAPPTATAVRFNAPTGQQERMERLARRFAQAMNDPGFRARIHRSLADSPYPEHKLYFQGLLTDSNRLVLRAMARASGSRESEIEGDAANTVGLEIYLPVPAHRQHWRGDDGIIVATAFADGDIPVGFDLRGNRIELNAASPPVTPVLAIEPIETDFSRSPDGAKCLDCVPPPSGGGGGGGPGHTPPAPGLYMTYAYVRPQFESWLKGNPEYEVHILGQIGATDSLKTYQCAGEHSSGAYVYDQNGDDWTGNVLLFSKAQMDSYETLHPGQSWRVFLVEDDDTACQIRNGNNTLEDILQLLDSKYAQRTGARDSLLAGGTKIIKNAMSLQDIMTLLAHIINTNDEMVGNAIEDVVVGQYFGVANWVVRGEDDETTGWINLEMR